MTSLTAERLREIAVYNPDTGKFVRRISSGKWRAGNEGGWLDERGYYRVQIDGVMYWGHRLAYLYMTGQWPQSEVDHVDGDRSNTRWANLRLCNMAENLCNRGPQKNSATGLKGVVPMRNKFQAQIAFRGERRHLGTFATAVEAHQTYCREAAKLHGEFAKTE